MSYTLDDFFADKFPNLNLDAFIESFSDVDEKFAFTLICRVLGAMNVECKPIQAVLSDFMVSPYGLEFNSVFLETRDDYGVLVQVSNPKLEEII